MVRHPLDLPIDPDLPADGRSGRSNPAILGAVAGGGALGGLGRYALAELIPAGGAGFPWATFSANLAGSFALGLLLVLAIERLPSGRYLRSFLTTGFLGAFTTFSAFAVETGTLLGAGRVAIAAIYVPASLLIGPAAAYTGISVARRLLPDAGTGS